MEIGNKKTIVAILVIALLGSVTNILNIFVMNK